MSNADQKEVIGRNTAAIYSNNFTAMQNINKSKNVSFKGQEIENVPYDGDINNDDIDIGIDIDITELSKRKYGDEYVMVPNPSMYGPKEVSVPRYVACTYFRESPYYYSEEQCTELKNEWKKELLDAVEDKEHKRRHPLVRREDIARYFAEHERIEELIDTCKNNEKEDEYFYHDVLTYGLVKADRADEAIILLSDEHTIVGDVIKECVKQGKYDDALRIRSENLNDVINLKSDKLYDDNSDIALMDYLLASERDEEAFETFGEEINCIILLYAMQGQFEKVFGLINTPEDLEHNTPFDQKHLDFPHSLERIRHYISGSSKEKKHYGNVYSKDSLAECAREYLISQGREDEADMRFPVEENPNYIYQSNSPRQTPEKLLETGKKEEDIRKIFEAYKQHSGYSFPEILKKASDENKDFAVDFIENKADIADYEQQKKQEAVDKAEGFMDRDYSIPKRAAIDIITLGIAELANKNSREQDKEKRLQEVDEDVRTKKDTINASKTMLLDCRDSNLNSKHVKSSDMNSLEEQKEEVKKALQSRYLTPLSALKYGTPAKLPNCIMLTGDTPGVMKKFIDWTGKQAEKAKTNYVKLPSIPDKDEMYNNILDTLEQAEENYQNSGNRSLIFVNGMDKLLREDTNTQSEIASMKDIMSDTDENFHSTLIFYTTNPDKLDEGTTASHRVGLKVNVPFDKFKIDEGE